MNNYIRCLSYFYCEDDLGLTHWSITVATGRPCSPTPSPQWTQLAVDTGCRTSTIVLPKVRNFHCHSSKKIDSVKHLLPPIVLFQNHFSYKQGGLAGPRSQMHSVATRERESAFGACTLGGGPVHWGGRIHTVEKSSNIERMSKR